jgi:hypothetical protein
MKIARSSFAVAFLSIITSLSTGGFADEATKSEWEPLFNGKDTAGWMSAAGKEPGKNWQAADGTLKRTGKGGDIWTKARYGDFVLELEFKTQGNSGVFFRTDAPTNNVQTGIEIQVEKAGGPDKHSVGALYDLKAPTKNVGKNDDWNKYVITCKGPTITVELNGEKVNEMNVDEWKDAGKNPDGSNNKYKKPLKDWKREGHIGLQDHGNEVAFRNLRIKPLK